MVSSMTRRIAALAVAGCSLGCSGTGPSTHSAGGNTAPVADAGIGRGVKVLDTLALDGTASHDAERSPLTYRWRLIQSPAGSRATLSGSETSTPTLVPDKTGAYVAELVVHDGTAASAPALVRIDADSGADLRVGPGRSMSRPSEAAAAARDGDIITIDATTYSGDAATWRSHDLTIRGVGGRPKIVAAGANAGRKGTWLIQGRNATVENIEFTGAHVKDENGAGIRQEGRGLTVRRCYFHDNENGMLVGNDDQSDVLIEFSEFARNGFGRGQTHNLYVNRVRSLTLRFNYFHQANVGHNVKSRAARTTLICNRILDKTDGGTSYCVEMPNGGLGILIGNQIQQGPSSNNPTLVSFGAEGAIHAINELHLSNNTLVNDRAEGTFVRVWPGGRAWLQNNIFAGKGRVLQGDGTKKANLVAVTPRFADRSGYDFALATGSKAIDAAIDPGSTHGVSLRPTSEYAPGQTSRPRPVKGRLDIGALEAR